MSNLDLITAAISSENTTSMTCSELLLNYGNCYVAFYSPPIVGNPNYWLCFQFRGWTLWQMQSRDLATLLDAFCAYLREASLDLGVSI